MERKISQNLQFIHEHHIKWKAKSGCFSVLGAMSMDLSTLRVSLHLVDKNAKKHRFKIDLYDYEQMSYYAKNLSEKADVEYGVLEKDLLVLTDLLEKYREQSYITNYSQVKPNVKQLPLETQKKYRKLLESPTLLNDIKDQLTKIGIAGEEKNCLLLFMIGMSYKHVPLHALVHASSGSGKSHLINTIAQCFPKEDVLSFTRVTAKSLYHFNEDSLSRKLIILQDMDGLEEDALFALRELQSFGELALSTTGKDTFGNHRSKVHIVKGDFASFGATTKTMYHDNSSRSILLQLDESHEQTKRILNYPLYTKERIVSTQNELATMIRMLEPQKVFDPMADQLCVNSSIPNARRLNELLRKFVEQITFIHQYQRQKDEHGRLLTTQEDREIGLELLSDCLLMKMDELDGGTRSFYEQLKQYKPIMTDDTFSQREVRQYFRIPKTSLQRYLKSLLEMEYIEIASGNTHKGYRYKIVYRDSKEQLKQQLLDHREES